MENDNYLREWRKSKGLSRKQLAEISGVHLRTIISYENGEKNLFGAGVDTLYKLCCALDIDNPLELIEVYKLIIEKEKIIDKRKGLN